MALRAMRDLRNAVTKTFKVTAGKTVTKNQPVKFTPGAETIEPAGAGELAIGFAIIDGTEGKDVSVALPFSAIVGAKVGTGGATAGNMAVAVEDGVADASHASGEGDPVGVCGMFLESGVAGDVVGLGILAQQLPAADSSVMPFVVTAAKTVAAGQLVKFSSGADTIEPAGAGEAGIGIALDAGDGDEEEEVRVQLLVTKVVTVTVGTGGATAGAFAANVNDGFADAAEIKAEAGLVNVVGLFLKAGSQGEEVPMGLLAFTTYAGAAP